MRYLTIMFSLLLLSCGNSVKRPDNLISRENMVKIIYDLAVIEATRTQIPRAEQKYGESPQKFIFRKYNIDSLQFVNSNTYYAAEPKKYKKIFDEVSEKLTANKTKADSLAKVLDENPAFKKTMPIISPEEGVIK